MKPESTAEQLLNDLLEKGAAGVADSSAASDQLAALAKQDPTLAGRIREELEFSEMIRQILLQDRDLEKTDIFEAIESEELSCSDLFERVKSGDATARECNLLVGHIWKNPEESKRLRRELADDELLFQTVSSSKSEESFMEALETRMWAGVRDDHFVEDLESRLESENTIEFPGTGTWKKPLLQLGALAAAVAIGAFIAVTQFGDRKSSTGTTVAEIIKTSGDVIWSNDSAPMENGEFKTGHYSLTNGVISMRFASGQEMTIQGPALFEVKSDSSAVVHSGIAMAKSPNEDMRFTLKSKGVNFSESAKLIGIDARSEDSTNALVFGGDVGVCLTDGGKCREIYEFEAVRADNKHHKLVDIPYQPHVFRKTWELISGVEKNMGQVRIEMPGAEIQPFAGNEDGTVQVFVEKESFHPEQDINVDQSSPGYFASDDTSSGQLLQAKGDLRSYLVQLWPDTKISTSSDGETVEASLTFDHPVAGLIFSSDRLEASDSLVGTSISHIGVEDLSNARGLDIGGDTIILSKDRRTINLRLKSGASQLDQVRVLVALN